MRTFGLRICIIAIVTLFAFSSCDRVAHFVGLETGSSDGGGGNSSADTDLDGSPIAPPTSETEADAGVVSVSVGPGESAVRIFSRRGRSGSTETLFLEATTESEKEIYAIYYNHENYVAAPVTTGGTENSGRGTPLVGSAAGTPGAAGSTGTAGSTVAGAAGTASTVGTAASAGGVAARRVPGRREITARNRELARAVVERGPERRGVTIRGSGIVDPFAIPDPRGMVDTFWVTDFYRGWRWRYARVVAYADDESANRRVRVWVDEASGAAGSARSPVRTEMAEALAERFLQPGESNDIYDWVTNLLGREWGEHDYGNLIEPTGVVDILLTDIDGDEATDAGTVGYFYANDNFEADPDDEYLAYSNEKVLFTIDAPLLAEAEGDTWEITDASPSYVVSTLAHEFQHMVHFYQRAVLRRQLSEVYFEEMLSMAAEDLLADKIGVKGPRGVSPRRGDAGSAGNDSGRMPWLVLYPDTPALTWLDDAPDGDGYSLVLRSYSLWYGFGAYLLRNYGGAELMPALLDGDGPGDQTTVLSALSSRGVSTSWEALYLRFVASLLLSDGTDAPEELRLNRGDWFESANGDQRYNLGSINAYNYRPRFYDEGPFYYTNANLPATIPADTAVIEYLGRFAPGTSRITTELPAGGNYNGEQAVGLVVKDAD